MQPGDLVGERFVIEHEAGAGGMGRVYRARDRHTGREVALKVLQGAAGAHDAGRFSREARVLAELSHPGIVGYVAHGTTPAGQQFLAMEWLEGHDVAVRIAQRPFSIGESVALARCASDALGSAHARGVVHRDVKPSNLFLVGGRADDVRVLDFGIARMGAAALGATRTGGVLGTPGYMAPEQARGAHAIDARADVFALGCVLYECLTGRPPFVGEHAMAVLAKVLFEQAPRVRELRVDVPEALDALVAEMIAKDPALRPADGNAVAARIAALGEGLEGFDRPSYAPAPREGLTGGEQRLVCVVFARDGAERTAVARRAQDTPGTSKEPDATGALRETARAFGGQLEALADGSLVMTVRATGAATDQAGRAARAALALRDAMADGVVMALATGLGDARSTGLAAGEAIDRAARLVNAALAARGATEHEGVVLLDEVTAGLLDARFDVATGDAGLELRGERDSADGTRMLLGRPSPCVGREREIATLEAVYAGCVGEPLACVVLITGAAGVGKSRLRHEFERKRRPRTDGDDEAPRAHAEVHVGRGDPLAAGSPFGMIAPALRRLAGVLDGEPLGIRRDKLRARVALRVAPEHVARVTEFLGEVVGVPFDDAASVQLRAARTDARLMGDQMRRAWLDFLAAECAHHPVVFLLDDLHWGDLPSVQFVDAALRTLHDQPFMVLGLARPEVHELFPRLWIDRGVQEIRLPELSRKSSEKLVRQVLGERVGTETMARMVEQAAGNAFYLEELIRAEAEGKGERLPGTVLAMVQARLERLEPEARRILRAGSVFGRAFWRGGALALLGADEQAHAARDWLDELVTRELLVQRNDARFTNEVEYAFRHGLVREAAYAMLTDRDRLTGHRLAGGWLERAGETDAMVLAEHFERGGEPARAVAHYKRAAEQALGGNDLAGVLARAERGVRCGAADAMRGELRLIQAEAHYWLGENSEAELRAREAMDLLPAGSAAWCNAVGEAAGASGKLGHRPLLIEATRALRDQGRLDDPRARLAAARMAHELLYAGLPHEADVLIEWIDPAGGAAVAHDTDPAQAGWIAKVRALRAAFDADPESMVALMAVSVDCFARAGDLRLECQQRGNHGYALSEMGLYPEAEIALRAALATAEQMGIASVSAAIRHNLSLALARRGKLDEAEQMARDVVEIFATQGNRRLEGATRAYRAYALLRAGRHDEAERETQTAVDTLVAVSPPACAVARAIQAQVRLARHDARGALETSQAAMDQLESPTGADEGESMVRQVYAEALIANGEHARAAEVIAVARTRLLERADRIRDASLRARFLADIPENARTLELARASLGGSARLP